MKELNYISDKELEQLILQVEQEELVAAPPDMVENILARLETEVTPRSANRQKDFYAYCFRVITSVAAAIALVFLLPELSAGMEKLSATSQIPQVQTPEYIRQEVPKQQEIVGTVPSREEIVTANQAPSKEEVLNDTGLVEQILKYTEQFYKKENKQ